MEQNPRFGNNVIIIREIYENAYADEFFERELDKALETNCPIIIIEPKRLGEETAQWVKVGNCLHKCAIVFGLSSVSLSFVWNRNVYKLLVPLTLVSVLCAGLYMICWQFDPCCKYQVANEAEKHEIKDILLARMPRDSIDYPILRKAQYFPTTLYREDDRTRKIVHSIVALCAVTCTIWRFYK